VSVTPLIIRSRVRHESWEDGARKLPPSVGSCQWLFHLSQRECGCHPQM